MAEVPDGSFRHTLEDIDAATTQVENAKGDAESLAAAITAAAESVVSGLDATEVGGSGKYISAIKEENGIIVPTPETMDTTPTNGSKKAITSEAVYTALAGKASVSNIYGIGTVITAGTDINDLKTPGVYTCETVTIANTLVQSSLPVTGTAFRLEVKLVNNANRIRQEFYAVSDTSGFYARSHTSASGGGSSWKGWYLFAGTLVT